MQFRLVTTKLNYLVQGHQLGPLNLYMYNAARPIVRIIQ